MTLLEKLKSLFGKGSNGSKRPGGNDGVTVDSDTTQAGGREAPPPMSGREDANADAETGSTETATDTGEETDEPVESEDAPADREAESGDAGSEDEGIGADASAETESGADESVGTPIEEAEPDDGAATESDDGAAAGSDAGGSTETISRVPEEDDGAAEQGEAVGAAETDAAPTAEKTTDDDPEPTEVESEPVTEVKGIGSAYADRLAEAGVDSTLALAESDAEELAAETDIAASRIEDWIDRANDR